MNRYVFKVAECYFAVRLPKTWSVANLLPSFRPFWVREEQPSDLLFCLEVSDVPIPLMDGEAKLLEETFNDLGHVRVCDAQDKLQIEINYDRLREKIHVLQVTRDFTEGCATLLYEDPSASVALGSMLRMLFAQTIIRKRGISVHASCVANDGLGYLFLGKSGTGKSTHAEQWMEVFPGCSLLNDDNPIVRFTKKELRVYGSPWSGKKHCYKQEGYPVGGMVRLYQAPANRSVVQEGIQAFSEILPSCSVLRNDIQLQDVLYDLLVDIVEHVPVISMYCLPNHEAAVFCNQIVTDTRKHLN